MRARTLRLRVNGPPEEMLRDRRCLEFQGELAERDVVLSGIDSRWSDALQRGERPVAIAGRRQRASQVVTREIDVEAGVDALTQGPQRRLYLTGLEQRLPVDR